MIIPVTLQNRLANGSPIPNCIQGTMGAQKRDVQKRSQKMQEPAEEDRATVTWSVMDPSTGPCRKEEAICACGCVRACLYLCVKVMIK